MTKAQTLAALGNQLDSFYSLEQVINIVKNIEEGSSRKITTLDINRAIDKVVDYMDRDQREIFDFDNAELEMSYDNRVECVGVPINTDAVREVLENNFMDFGEEENDIVELERETLVEGGEFRTTGDL
jgi:hypothetical protein